MRIFSIFAFVLCVSARASVLLAVGMGDGDGYSGHGAEVSYSFDGNTASFPVDHDAIIDVTGLPAGTLSITYADGFVASSALDPSQFDGETVGVTSHSDPSSPVVQTVTVYGQWPVDWFDSYTLDQNWSLPQESWPPPPPPPPPASEPGDIGSQVSSASDLTGVVFVLYAAFAAAILLVLWMVRAARAGVRHAK